MGRHPSRPQTLFKSAKNHQHQLSWISSNWYWVHTGELIGQFTSWLCSCTNHWTESRLPINLSNHKVGTTRKLRAKFCHYCAIFFVIDLYGDRCWYTMIQITLCWVLKLYVCCVPSWHWGAFCWGLRCQSFSSIASLAAPSKSLQFLRTARIRRKQSKRQGPKLYSKVLTIEPNRLL